MTGQIVELKLAIKRGRNVIRFLTISLVFDILLSLGLGYVAHRAWDASNAATRATATATAATVANAETLKANCLSANEARAQNLAMWHGLIDLFPPAQSETGQKRISDILDLADRTFAPRDCS